LPFTGSDSNAATAESPAGFAAADEGWSVGVVDGSDTGVGVASADVGEAGVGDGGTDEVAAPAVALAVGDLRFRTPARAEAGPSEESQRDQDRDRHRQCKQMPMAWPSRRWPRRGKESGGELLGLERRIKVEMVAAGHHQ
jgi:hypothetical protein